MVLGEGPYHGGMEERTMMEPADGGMKEQMRKETTRHRAVER